MSGFVGIGLIVVVWLIVLAPLLLRSQKPIRKAGEAFDETRVIHEGGSGIPERRRPHLAAESTGDEQVKPVGDAYEIVEEPSIFRHRREEDETQPESKETEVFAEDIVVSETVTDEDAEWNEEDHYPLEDSDTTPADLLHPVERERAAAEFPVADNSAEEEAEEIEELTDEDEEFARRRRGRGYYDPQADREFAQSQYVRRQRTLIGLAALVVVTVILGVVVGGWVWSLPVLSALVTASYLAALRNQVRAENQLRARRIRRLRRSRLGVRHPEDVPARLRRPGAVIVDLDDESPDFEGLDLTYAPATEEPETRGQNRPRRVG
ncbi:gephyrin-like molybdotransferase receptor GlpR [Corynebacterium pacaense]|uniref:divisome protein SepX/GlpR n=1 Tax=Corynebacterium pacaense TaxID=1816684 RepID=UPI0009BBA709|nr:gephyrin-like molybdotransferase receptor GlpR [Corynebacterium pacaense]